MAEQQSWQEQAEAKRIEANLERGLWADFRTSRLYSAVVRQSARRYEMAFRTPGIQEHGTEEFETIDDLIEAMREVEPDLRKWRLCEEG